MPQGRCPALYGFHRWIATTTRLCENFFATLECERLDRRNYRTQAEARMSVFQYIEGWYDWRLKTHGSRTGEATGMARMD